MTDQSKPRHFLSLLDLSSNELRQLVSRASELKQLRRSRQPHTPLRNKVLGMIFEKSSNGTMAR